MANLRSQFEQALTNIEINRAEAEARHRRPHGDQRAATTGPAAEGMGRRAAADRLLRSGYRYLSRQGCGCLLTLY